MAQLIKSARNIGLTIFPVHGGYRVSNLDGVFSFEQLMEVFK
jgi:biotin operon repressor